MHIVRALISLESTVPSVILQEVVQWRYHCVSVTSKTNSVLYTLEIYEFPDKNRVGSDRTDQLINTYRNV